MRSLVLAAALLAFAPAAHAADLAAQVDRYLKALDQTSGFSGSVLIARDGKILVERGFGMADVEHEVKNTPYTRFRVGSITKQFTAAAVMLLEHDGRLGVSDSICRYLTECPKSWQPVTLHHLLTHTSGIPSYTDQPDFAKSLTLPTPPVETAKRMAKLPLEFAPGTRHRYSNSGYVLLGLVIEKASGKPYEQFLKERIFEPLGMQSSGYDHAADLLPHRARGYTPDERGSLKNAAYLDMSIPFAAGALYSTVEDLLKWDQALYRDDLLPREARERMFTPFLDQYAYGWVVGILGAHKQLWHNGGINGFASHLSRFVDDHLLVVVLCNRTDAKADEAGRALAQLALGMPTELPKVHVAVQLDEKKLELVVGEYELRPGFSIVIRREGTELTAQATGQGKLALFAESEREFFLKAVDAQLSFQGEPGRPATTLVLHQNGRDLPGKRVK
jgi:CubicO group peptidase (beta-lactamase class C family)